MPAKVVYASWGDALRGYEAEKKRLPWEPDQYHPEHNRRVTRQEVSKREREFNPLAMKYRDQAREEAQVGRERERLSKQRQVARAKQLRMGQRFNIISNEVFSDAPPRPVRPIRARQPDTNAKFNILNNAPHHKHKDLKMVTTEGAMYIPTPRRVLLDGGKKPLSHFKREFDVISNRYHDHHDERMVADEARLREDSQKKYWRTHDYNPLQGEYYDKEKERQYLTRRVELFHLHGQAKSEREPPSYKFSEGHAYDLINKEVKDEEKSNLMLNASLKGIKAKKKTAIEATQSERAIKIYETRELRRTNRVHPERYEMESRRGYNVITNTAFEGEGHAARPPHRARARPSQWSRLEACGRHGGGGDGGGVTKGGASTAPAPLESLLRLHTVEDGNNNNNNSNNNNNNNNNNHRAETTAATPTSSAGNNNNNQRAAAQEDENNSNHHLAVNKTPSPPSAPRAQTSDPIIASSARRASSRREVVVPPLAL